MWKNVNLKYRPYLFYFLGVLEVVAFVSILGFSIYLVILNPKYESMYFFFAFVVLPVLLWSLLTSLHREFYELFPYFVKQVRVLNDGFEIINLHGKYIKISYEKVADVVFGTSHLYGEKFKPVRVSGIIVDQWIERSKWFRIIVPRQYIQIDLPAEVGEEILDKWTIWRERSKKLINGGEI